jgi:hypothetical protein
VQGTLQSQTPHFQAKEEHIRILGQQRHWRRETKGYVECGHAAFIDRRHVFFCPCSSEVQQKMYPRLNIWADSFGEEFSRAIVLFRQVCGEVPGFNMTPSRSGSLAFLRGRFVTLVLITYPFVVVVTRPGTI